MDDSKTNKDNISEMSKNTQQEKKSTTSNKQSSNIINSKRQSKDNISDFSKKSKNTDRQKYNPQNDLSDTSEIQLDNLSQKYSQDKFNSEQLFSSDINKINKDQYNYIDNSSPEFLINKSIKNFKEISKEEKEKNEFFLENKSHYSINAKDSEIYL